MVEIHSQAEGTYLTDVFRVSFNSSVLVELGGRT